MKSLKLSIIAMILTVTLISCGGNLESNAEGFTEIENEIKAEFGVDAYFTDLSILYDKSIGHSTNITVTKDPESMILGEWMHSQDSWSQTAEVSIEIPEGTQATDFMFQLGDDIKLSKLGELIEKSKKQLKDEKNLESPTLSLASISFPDNGDISKAEYFINLEPENGGTTFTFRYSLNGEFLNMDY